MIQKQTQIKINLPIKLKNKIEKRAGEYDFTLAGYVKYLMVSDLESVKVPVLRPSKETIKAYREAKKEEKEGKLTEIKNISEFFANIGK